MFEGNVGGDVLCFLGGFLPRLFPHRKVFSICFSSSRTEFRINVNNAEYNILEIVSDLKKLSLRPATIVSCAKVS